MCNPYLFTGAQSSPFSSHIAILCTEPLDAHAGLIGEISFNAMIQASTPLTSKPKGIDLDKVEYDMDRVKTGYS